MERKTLIKLASEYFDEVSKKYFSSFYGKFPLPKIIFKKNHKSTGEYVWTHVPKIDPQTHKKTFEIIDQNIIVDLDYANNHDELRKVVFHEAIHYYDNWINGFDSVEHKLYKGHNPFFKQMMNTINNKEGENYITIKSPTTSLWNLGEVSTYYVYMVPVQNKHNSNLIDFIIAWAPTTKFILRMLNIMRYTFYETKNEIPITKNPILSVIPTKHPGLKNLKKTSNSTPHIYHITYSKESKSYQAAVEIFNSTNKETFDI